MTMRGVNGGGTKRRMRAEAILSKMKLQQNRMSSFLQEASRSLMEGEIGYIAGGESVRLPYLARQYGYSLQSFLHIEREYCSIFHNDPTIDHDHVDIGAARCIDQQVWVVERGQSWGGKVEE